MYISETKIRVRYAETDQMGYVYYGNYAEFYEVGRVEALRALGWDYKSIEESGIMLPVLEFKIKYFKPAFYDDELTIKTIIKSVPGARIIFEYECYNTKGDLLNVGETTLVFINRSTGRPCSPPEALVQALGKYVR